MAGRPSGPKTRCSGKWTEAKFNSFIKNTLRRATQRWGPIHDCMTAARVERGIYLCANCKEHVPATIKEKNRRLKNVHVDHILPVIDPTIGFETWDKTIDRMFCEVDGLQVLCTKCHDIKTNEERAAAKVRRQSEKE